MRKALVAASLALMLTVAACGDTQTDGTGGATGVFSSAVELARAATDSAAKSESSRFSIEMDVLGMAFSGTGSGRYDGVDSAMEMALDMFGMELELRMVDQVIYLRMPEEMAAEIPGADLGKPWQRMPLGEMPDGMGELFEYSDPADTLKLISDYGTITDSSKTELDGTSAMYYAVDLDLAKMSGDFPMGMSAEDIADMREMGFEAMPMEVWLDEENLPMRVTMDMTEMFAQIIGAHDDELGDDFDLKATMTFDYSDWGVPVEIDAPPADQVAEVAVN